MSAELAIEKRGRVAILTLSNPRKRNALDATLLSALRSALTTLPEADGEVRAAVITGAGGAGSTFSAGSDLTALPDQPEPEWLVGHGALADTMRLLCEGPLPTVAAINGPAIGAGCELALSCDLRVAAEAGSLCMPPVRLGIIYTPEGVARMMSLCGAARARRMLLLGETITSEQAESWGLVDLRVPDAELLDAALRLAGELADRPRLAVQGTRRLIERILREGPSLRPESAAEMFELRKNAWCSPEAKAARDRIKRGRRQ
jgi:enoyl-CoA hydratase/carnithine racemase